MSNIPGLLHQAEMGIAKLQGRADGLTAARDVAQSSERQAAMAAAYHREALLILQELEKAWRGSFEEALAAVVSQGLRTIFGDDIQGVRVKNDVKRGVSSMKLVIVDAEDNETDILDYEGGSLVNVVTTLLRVLLVVSSNPPMRRLLILDEPFSMVSVEYRSALCQLLRELAGRLDIQFLIVTHEEELIDAADVAYLVEKKGGQAHITQLKSREEVQA